MRQSAGVSSAFILANSLAGLAGTFTSVRGLPPSLPILLVAAGLGGFLEAGLGAGGWGTARFVECSQSSC